MPEVAVDDDEAVSEHLRGKHRQPDKGCFPQARRCDVLRQGHFGDVVPVALHHHVKEVARIVDLHPLESDPFRLHSSGAQRLHAIVASAGERQFQVSHGVLLNAHPFLARFSQVFSA